MSVEVGNVLEGKVVSIMPFGAFVSIGAKTTGLVHISEIAADYVKDVNEHLKVGDAVKVKVIKIDEKGKISLSIKKALVPKPKKPAVKAEEPKKVRPMDIDFFSRGDGSEMSFEDKLSKFKQDSDEKMQALRRSNESKRSGGYKRGGGSY